MSGDDPGPPESVFHHDGSIDEAALAQWLAHVRALLLAEWPDLPAAQLEKWIAQADAGVRFASAATGPDVH